MLETLGSNWRLVAGLVGLFAVFGFYFSWQYIGYRRRRAAISSRVSCSQDEWFRRYYSATEEQQDLLVQILQALAFEIGVDWTQLRPDDTFEWDLFVGSSYARFEDLEEANLVTWDLVRKKQLAEERLPNFKGTLRAFLDGIAAASVSSHGSAHGVTS